MTDCYKKTKPRAFALDFVYSLKPPVELVVLTGPIRAFFLWSPPKGGTESLSITFLLLTSPC